MNKLLSVIVFILILFVVWLVQYFYFSMSLKEISTSIGIFTAFIGALFFIWHKIFFPFVSKLQTFSELFSNLFTSVESISKELQPNHGSSIKDSVNRIDSKLSIIEAEMTIFNENNIYPMFRCDNHGYNLSVNRTFCRIIGCSRDEILGFGWKRFTKEIEQGWEEAQMEGREVSTLMVVEDIDGNELRFERHCFPTYNNNNELVYYMGFLIPVNSSN